MVVVVVVVAAVEEDAAEEVAEVEGYGEGTAWAAYVLAFAVADAATVALEDEGEAAGVAEAVTGPSLKGEEKSVVALCAIAVGTAASGYYSGTGCGEEEEEEEEAVLHPPEAPGEAGGVGPVEAWVAG